MSKAVKELLGLSEIDEVPQLDQLHETVVLETLRKVSGELKLHQDDNEQKRIRVDSATFILEKYPSFPFFWC
jgi:hypothetical protein